MSERFDAPDRFIRRPDMNVSEVLRRYLSPHIGASVVRAEAVDQLPAASHEEDDGDTIVRGLE